MNLTSSGILFTYLFIPYSASAQEIKPEGKNFIQIVKPILQKVDFNNTVIYQKFTNEDYLVDNLFGLFEARYAEENIFNLGVSLNTTNEKKLDLNHMSYLEPPQKIKTK